MTSISKNNPLLKFAFILTSSLLFCSQALAFSDWWQCADRKGGEWHFGRVPYVCLVDHMQTQSFVNQQYGPVLFMDSSERDSERKRYMTELNALAKEVTAYYIKKRKPNVSQSEINAFTKGVLTLMHQETFWSHYRKNTDQKVRYMRGDVGHGHGLMQVDDRSHQNALLEGRGADLVYNMLYGLDVFYAQWERAPSQSCVDNPSNYTARIRSAWAAYNGGPGRICRWTSTTGPYAHHDKDFYSKLQNQSFKNYVTSESKKTDLNVQCLGEGSRPCANNGNGPVQLIDGELYQVGSGYFCLLEGDELHCLDRLNDVNCLNIRDQRNYSSRGQLSDEQVSRLDLKYFDRNYICKNHVQGLSLISQEMELKKSINLRKTPAGELIRTIPSGTSLKIIDFEVTTTSSQERYYRLSYNGSDGYVYAGDKSDHHQWLQPVEDRSTSLLANIGEVVKIVAPNGINLRATAGGKLITLLPKNSELEVLDREIRGTQNYLYYKVEFEGQKGFIYSGYLADMDSLPQWTQVVQSTEKLLKLASNQTYQFLKSCPQADCEFTASALRAEQSADWVYPIESKDEWVLVETQDKTKKGWIRSSDLGQVN